MRHTSRAALAHVEGGAQPRKILFRRKHRERREHPARLAGRLRNKGRVPRLALALERIETSDHLERVLKYAQIVAVDELVRGRAGCAPAGAPGDIVIEQASLDRES